MVCKCTNLNNNLIKLAPSNWNNVVFMKLSNLKNKAIETAIILSIVAKKIITFVLKKGL